jgi:hypothetical protein
MAYKNEYKKLIEKEEKFEIKTIHNFDQLKKFKEQYNHKDFIYRGVNNWRYKMYTSFQRSLIFDRKNYSEVRSNYQKMLMDCLRNSDLILIGNEYRNTEKIQELWFDVFIKCNSHLQHYHLLSPLLDFTTDFDTAIFFAFYSVNTNNEYVSLYILDPEKLNKKVNLKKELNFSTNTISAQPNLYYQNASRENVSSLNYFDRIQNVLFNSKSEHAIIEPSTESENERIKAQNGLFLLLNTPHVEEKIKPFEDIYIQNTDEKITCLHLKTTLLKEVIKDLTNKCLTKKSLLLDNKDNCNKCSG